MSEKSLGQIAYDGYSACPEIGGKAFNGDPLKTWNELGSRIQAGWEAAAQAVVNATTSEVSR